jgi:hypothetical protein
MVSKIILTASIAILMTFTSTPTVFSNTLTACTCPLIEILQAFSRPQQYKHSHGIHNLFCKASIITTMASRSTLTACTFPLMEALQALSWLLQSLSRSLQSVSGPLETLSRPLQSFSRPIQALSSLKIILFRPSNGRNKLSHGLHKHS